MNKVAEIFRSVFSKEDAQELVANAEEAAAIAKLPLVRNALESMKTGTVAQIAACDKTDVPKLTELALKLQLLDEFANWFLETMAEGELAAQRLKETEAEEQRQPRRW